MQQESSPMAQAIQKQIASDNQTTRNTGVYDLFKELMRQNQKSDVIVDDTQVRPLLQLISREQSMLGPSDDEIEIQGEDG